MTAFEEMGVLPEIAQAVEEMDWNLPTDVQAEAIPLILGGGDVLMAAETGSGKTGAFCLPILQIVWETLSDQLSGKSKKSDTGGGSAQSSKWRMSYFDRGSALAVSPDGKMCQSREPKEWHGCRATKGVQGKGKYYYEAKVTDEGLCRVGWSTPAASLDLGTDKQGFGFGGTGKKSFGKQFDSYGEPFGMHDVIGCFLNLDNMIIKFSKNGVDLGDAFKIPDNLRRSAFFPAVVLKNAEMEFNFGETSFKYPPEDGYVAICSASKECTVNSTVTGESSGPVKNIKNAPQAIIIEPSRELAKQTLKCIQNFKKHLHSPNVKELLIIGGVSAKEQIMELQSGIDIVVGTPGRLEDLISTGQLSLSQVQFFVLDEADGLLSAGYGDLINRIHQQIPKITPDGKRLQMVVCSATLHSFDVKKLAERLMHFPTWVDLKGEDSVPETVHHVVCMVDPRTDTSWRNLKRPIKTDEVHAKDNTRFGSNTPEMLSEAVKLLKGEYVITAINEHKMDKGIIFCRTKIDCDNMENHLNALGGGPRNRNNPYSCVCLHGDRKPAERKENLEKFKRGEVKFLICTDVAARGIDVTGVPYVINMTLPDEKNNYVHRIGRVGRAERMGLAISLVSAVPEKVWYHSNCSSRGKNCWNTRLTDQGGCCIWYNEPQYLADIEEHLNCTIQQVDPDLKVPCDEFDGKVVYGQKKAQMGSNYQTHTAQMAPTVEILAELEMVAQKYFIKRYCMKDKSFLK
ncbi:ATP-dependent RNA helicase DDX1-like [Stegodyphus dumicola]|uniref:ATP-dependent RNA helicase DDX1-like n=1 Tax=Stegodyphus dumicola TaxID=202533 RepID=UPI0015A87A96|nr:ATP-dependent RNA helicase DDX1-like [Stegodyphus dumicola]